jgi:uncharacterized damage-inducible protein DinB
MNDFNQLFDYDRWANLRALESLATGPSGQAEPQKLFAHILGAQRVWLWRFKTPDPPNAEPWPAMDLNEMRAAVEELAGEWRRLLEGMTDEQAAGDLMYRTTKGKEFRTPVRDVLMHLVMHSAYHRGQVARAVRQAGGQPAVTDYIVYVRQGPK